MGQLCSILLKMQQQKRTYVWANGVLKVLAIDVTLSFSYLGQFSAENDR